MLLLPIPPSLPSRTLRPLNLPLSKTHPLPTLSPAHSRLQNSERWVHHCPRGILHRSHNPNTKSRPHPHTSRSCYARLWGPSSSSFPSPFAFSALSGSGRKDARRHARSTWSQTFRTRRIWRNMMAQTTTRILGKGPRRMMRIWNHSFQARNPLCLRPIFRFRAKSRTKQGVVMSVSPVQTIFSLMRPFYMVNRARRPTRHTPRVPNNNDLKLDHSNVRQTSTRPPPTCSTQSHLTRRSHTNLVTDPHLPTRTHGARTRLRLCIPK